MFCNFLCFVIFLCVNISEFNHLLFCCWTFPLFSVFVAAVIIARNNVTVKFLNYSVSGIRWVFLEQNLSNHGLEVILCHEIKLRLNQKFFKRWNDWIKNIRLRKFIKFSVFCTYVVNVLGGKTEHNIKLFFKWLYHFIYPIAVDIVFLCSISLLMFDTARFNFCHFSMKFD